MSICVLTLILGCEDNGVTYQSGDSVPSGDACNTCECLDGAVTCTEMACGRWSLHVQINWCTFSFVIQDLILGVPF